MKRMLMAVALVLGLAAGVGGCTRAGSDPAVTAAATVQRTGITLCDGYADALQVGAILRRNGSLSASQIASVDRIRATMTPLCSSPVTEATLQQISTGVAQILAVFKGGA